MISVTRQATAFAIVLLLTTILLCTVRVYINPFAIEVAESEFMPRWWDALLSGLMLFVAAIIINRTTVKIGLFGGAGVGKTVLIMELINNIANNSS